MVLDWIRIAFASVDESYQAAAPAAERFEANSSLFAYFAELLVARRNQPAGDLLSDLACVRWSGGEGLTDEEILFNVHLLLSGGQDTTRHALTGCVTAFMDHPGQWICVAEDPSTMPSAIEEILRWSSPSLCVMRSTTRDVVIGGHNIPAGDNVTIWNPIVNRDERAFSKAKTFDVTRDPNRHLTFGAGSHSCLGAWLARREMLTLLQQLRTSSRYFEWTRDGQRTRSSRTWGFDSVPMRIVG
jgi:cytochrome P450